MKKFIQAICVFTLIAGFVFSGPRPKWGKKAKSEIRIDAMKRIEPDYRKGSGESRANCAHALPNNPTTFTTIIDSSANGYGMVATVTRPMDVNDNGNMLTIYRQYTLVPNQTHGQLGAGFGVPQSDGSIEWTAQWNINANQGPPPWGDPGGGGVGGLGSAQARYPSAIAGDGVPFVDSYPYAVWNEYTSGPPTSPPWPANCSNYGGRPYYNFDELGWGENSWAVDPFELDPLYDCGKDLWSGSVGYGYNEVDGQHHVSAVYDDWTRPGSYLFTSEAVVNGQIVLGTENMIINPAHLGTEDYSSRAILSMNNDGEGLLGLDGIFFGNNMDTGECTSPITCNKTPMFKLTTDFGQTWAGNHASYDLYYVPDDVFDDIFESWPSEVVSDPCTGLTEPIVDFWSWYEFDMRVDSEGNPHIVISMIGETATDFPIIEGKTGFYHLTIDKDVLSQAGVLDDNPATNPINSPTGWNWSYIPLPANDSFGWSRPDGYSYLYGAMCQISIDRDDPNTIYMVSNIGEKGDMSIDYDANQDGVEDDPCVYQDWPWQLYPNWSEDIFVAKSTDNGTTWSAMQNLTQTPRDPDNTGENNCSPEEQYVHSAHWAQDDKVYFQYDQPNWEFNEIGDPLGADCMNYVWLGYSVVVASGGGGGCTNDTVCNYDASADFDDGSCANVIGTQVCDGSGNGTTGTTGCDCAGNCFTYIDVPMLIEGCDNVCGSGMTQVCDTANGGFDESTDGCIPGSDVCTQAWANTCEDDPDTDIDNDGTGDCTDDCNEGTLDDGSLLGEINYYSACDGEPCGANDPILQGCDYSVANMNGFPTWDGGRCAICIDSPSILIKNDCLGAGFQWDVLTIVDTNTGEPCNENSFGSCGDADGNPDDDTLSGYTTINSCYCGNNGVWNGTTCTSGVENTGAQWFICQDVYTTRATCPTHNANCSDDALLEEDLCSEDGWTPFVSDGRSENGEEPESCGPVADATLPDPFGIYCSCTPALAAGGASNWLKECTAGNVNGDRCENPAGCTAGEAYGDPLYNVQDIVQLANCILANDCVAACDNGCAANMNESLCNESNDIIVDGVPAQGCQEVDFILFGDPTINVQDIVILANCILANQCNARVDDASSAQITMIDNRVFIEADGFIGGVQMRIKHGADFSINMTEKALLADYLTSGNETRLLVVNPDTEDLFSYSGDFEIVGIMVVNSLAQIEVAYDDAPPIQVVASSFSLSDAYPNPFNPVTTMELFMPVAGDMQVEVYNLLGQSVATLASGHMDANTYTLTWDASNVASGVYFVKAQTTGFTKIQKLMLIK